MENFTKILDTKGLRFDVVDYRMQRGITPVICIDLARLVIDGPSAIKMQAYATKEAVDTTLVSGLATFWSRNKQGLWTGDLTNGSTMPVRSVYMGLDADCLLYDVNLFELSASKNERNFMEEVNDE